jgi:hypothetical protein
VSGAGTNNGLRGRGVWRMLNARPGWRVSLRRVYELLEEGQIPAVVLHGAHNTHYTVSPAALDEWAKMKERERFRYRVPE